MTERPKRYGGGTAGSRMRREENMSDRELEAAIDAAGRDRIFAIMRTAGWHSEDRPPLWVWWLAVYEAAQTSESGRSP